jgi:radical SAM family uncharacterized protein
VSALITDPHEIHDLLDREVLRQVEKPARYVNGEKNAVHKDPAGVDVRLVLAFPDIYEVGMSHLGTQVLYSIVNRLPWAAAERAYAVWPDMRAQMRERGIPLYALESFRPVREADVLGFSLQYELLYTNVLAMLDLAGIPLLSAERSDGDPVVIAGGPGAAVPEPTADFIDLFFPGDGEEVIVEFAELVREMKARRAPRRDVILEAARRIPGAYAPALYEPAWGPDGTFAGLRAKQPGLPERVGARKVASLADAPFPADLIVPFVETVHDRITLEIMRGCTQGCRFCQAGMVRRPVRARPIPQLVELARQAYASTGHSEIALASLSSSDYPDFQKLIEAVNVFAEPRGVGLSLSSLRVDDQLRLLPSVLNRVRKSGLTVAPEAATERLRRVINKDVTDAGLLAGARAAFSAGWRLIKLYFMVGLPTETDQDVAAIVDLSERVGDVRRELGGGPAQVNVSIAPFVPKPHTPFQWEPMASRKELEAKRRLIQSRSRRRNVRCKFHDPECSILEAALAHGDRRLGRVIRRAYEDGAQFDAWTEHFSFERWQRAFAAEGLDLEAVATRERAEGEALPWEHVDFGLRKDFLLRERRKAFVAELTPDCRTGECSLCGVCEPGGAGAL